MKLYAMATTDGEGFEVFASPDESKLINCDDCGTLLGNDYGFYPGTEAEVCEEMSEDGDTCEVVPAEEFSREYDEFSEYNSRGFRFCSSCGDKLEEKAQGEKYGVAC